MNTPLPQAELRALLSEGCFLRRATTDDALFVTDLPRRQTDQALASVQTRMDDSGFRIVLSQNGLWLIDLSERRWQALATAWQAQSKCAFPQQTELHAVYMLYRLLSAHPAPWPEQPREPLRALLKRYNQSNELLRLTLEMQQTFAERLRKHLPLPSSGAGLLCQWLHEVEKGEML